MDSLSLVVHNMMYTAYWKRGIQYHPRIFELQYSFTTKHTLEFGSHALLRKKSKFEHDTCGKVYLVSTWMNSRTNWSYTESDGRMRLKHMMITFEGPPFRDAIRQHNSFCLPNVICSNLGEMMNSSEGVVFSAKEWILEYHYLWVGRNDSCLSTDWLLLKACGVTMASLLMNCIKLPPIEKLHNQNKHMMLYHIECFELFIRHAF